MKVRGQTVYSTKERIERMSTPEPNSGCWIWLGVTRRNPAGAEYGRTTAGSRTDGTRKSMSAHRLSYEAYLGTIPAGMMICHRCDNPLCVNPDHLFAGTAKDNSDDRDRKGRLVPAPRLPTGGQHPQAKLTDDQVDFLRHSEQSSYVLAKELGVSARYIRDIRMGRARIAPTPPVNQSEGVGE